MKKIENSTSSQNSFHNTPFDHYQNVNENVKNANVIESQSSSNQHHCLNNDGNNDDDNNNRDGHHSSNLYHVDATAAIAEEERRRSIPSATNNLACQFIFATTFLLSLFGSVIAILWDQEQYNNNNGGEGDVTDIYNKEDNSTINQNDHHHHFNYSMYNTHRILATDGNNSTDCDSAQDSGWVNSIPKPLQYALITVLILFSAFFSGLTLSMMGLDTTGLEIVMSGDDPVLSRAAGKIYPIRKNGNLLLCTLLLGNVAVNTLLGILMADITGGTVGFITSTALIVVFGEIIPQALFSRYALQVGERAVPLVKFIIFLLYIIAKPLAFCLDKLLGHELGTTYSKAEMSKLLEIHVKEGRFNQEVGTAMKGALQYQDMAVKDVMTPLENTFMINVESQMTFEMMSTIFKTGYSRIPVYESFVGNVIGLLFAKDLIFIDPEDATPVKQLMEIFGRSMHFVNAEDKLGEVLRHLKSGHSHMALVRGIEDNDDGLDPVYTLEGIITLEDIIEEILGDEIVDETDKWVDGEHTEQVSREEAFDWSKLRLLDTKIVDKTLSDDEIRVVAAHLRQNYSSTVKDISEKHLKRMIGATAVTELEEVQKELGEDLPPASKRMYVKDEGSEFCTIILQGKVTVFAGNDNFRSDMSSWSVLATGALTEDDYKPDFNAYVSSGPCRCLRLRRDIFIAACHASTLEKMPDADCIGGNVIKKLQNGLHQIQNGVQQAGSDEEEIELTSGGTQQPNLSDTTSVKDVNDLNDSIHQNKLFSTAQIDQSSHSLMNYNGGRDKNVVKRTEKRGKQLATLFSENENKWSQKKD